MAKQISRNYSDRTLKILWGRGAGRCSVPTCRLELFADATDHDPMVVIGEIAHIEAASDRGPRANRSKTKNERDQYQNLILLCQNCHHRMDAQKKSNSVEFIQRLKEDHEAWVRNSLPERGRSTTGWAVLLLQGAHPFDLEPTIGALVPDFPSGNPYIIRADPQTEAWEDINRRLEGEVSQLLESGDPFDFRLAVFPLAPISACLGLGYYLTNRPRVRLFQYHRDDHSWAWFDEAATTEQISVAGLPENVSTETGELAICFHLSATIRADHITELGLQFQNVVNISIQTPIRDGYVRKTR